MLISRRRRSLRPDEPSKRRVHIRQKGLAFTSFSYCCSLPTWWLWRGGCTRSHSEHGRETPLRRWYFVLRRGRVGRCQVCQAQQIRLLQTQMPIFSSHAPAQADPNGPPSKRPFCFGKINRIKSPKAETSKQPNSSRFCLRQNAHNAGWSSPVARQAHNLKAAGSNPAPATKVTTKNPATET